MKTMLIAFVGIIVIAVLANYTLNNMGFSAQEQTSGSAVRLD